MSVPKARHFSVRPAGLRLGAAILLAAFASSFFLPVTVDGWMLDTGWQYAWVLAQSTFSASPFRVLGLAFLSTVSNVAVPLVLIALCVPAFWTRLPRATPWVLALLAVNASRFGWELVVLKSQTLLSGYWVWVSVQWVAVVITGAGVLDRRRHGHPIHCDPTLRQNRTSSDSRFLAINDPKR